MKKSIFFTLLFLGVIFQAQITSINENFESFTIGTTPEGRGKLPQKDWSSDKEYPQSMVEVNSKNGNKYIKLYSFIYTEPVYLMTPELASVNGKLTFYTNTSGGDLEVGLVSSATDMRSFEKISEYTMKPKKSSKVEIDIPKSTKKIIAFKYIPSDAHRVWGIDNVVFTPAELSTKDFNNKEISSVIFDTNTQKLVLKNTDIVKIQIYNSQGQLVLDKISPSKEESLSNLTSGVYIVVSESMNGKKNSTKIIVK